MENADEAGWWRICPLWVAEYLQMRKCYAGKHSKRWGRSKICMTVCLATQDCEVIWQLLYCLNQARHYLFCYIENLHHLSTEESTKSFLLLNTVLFSFLQSQNIWFYNNKLFLKNAIHAFFLGSQSNKTVAVSFLTTFNTNIWYYICDLEQKSLF